jgi:hypothetical protein
MVALGKQKMLQTYHSRQSWCWFLPLGFLLDDIRGLWVRISVGNVVFTELYRMCKLWNTLYYMCNIVDNVIDLEDALRIFRVNRG